MLNLHILNVMLPKANFKSLSHYIDNIVVILCNQKKKQKSKNLTILIFHCLMMCGISERYGSPWFQAWIAFADAPGPIFTMRLLKPPSPQADDMCSQGCRSLLKCGGAWGNLGVLIPPKNTNFRVLLHFYVTMFWKLGLPVHPWVKALKWFHEIFGKLE